ncbi:hypothetical protein BH10PSE1_BH10PSE1_07040 [soil metagenome]
MIHTGSSERLKASFARQFEQDGQGFLYRKDETGPAIRINAEEQADFISGYSRALKLAGWAMLATIVLGGFATGFYEGAFGADRKIWGVTGMAVLLLAFVLFTLWARRAPDRALRYRVPVAPGLSKDERKRLAFAKISYGALAIGLLAVPFMLWNAARAWDILHGWGRLWIAGGAALFALIAVQAFRKWRFESKDR